MTQKKSGKQWKAVKNSSWGEKHVANFGSKPGYVICYENNNRELCALATVIGQPFRDQTEIDANATLIELAPIMASVIEKLTELSTEQYKDIAHIIEAARLINDRLTINNKEKP